MGSSVTNPQIRFVERDGARDLVARLHARYRCSDASARADELAGMLAGDGLRLLRRS